MITPSFQLLNQTRRQEAPLSCKRKTYTLRKNTLTCTFFKGYLKCTPHIQIKFSSPSLWPQFFFLRYWHKIHIHVHVVVQFLSLFNFIFFCFMFTIIYLHKQEQRKIKIEPRIKLNHNIHTVFPPFRITFRKCCFHSWYIPGIVKVGEGRGGGIWFKSVGEVSIYYLKKIPISHS